MLDQALWHELETHGVSTTHMEMLLRLLQLQKNGAWSWHFVHGQLSQVDLRLVSSARATTWRGSVTCCWAGRACCGRGLHGTPWRRIVAA